MSITRYLLPTLLLLPFSACTDDDEPTDSEFFPGRVPCASETLTDGALSARRAFVYDAKKHLLSVEVRDAAGVVTSTRTNTWDGDHVIKVEITGTRPERREYTYQGEFVTRSVVTDLRPDDGDSGYTATWRYEGDAIVEGLVTYSDPARGGRRTTVTGDRSPRATWRDCPEPADGTACDVSVWEQLDNDPAKWTRATFDFGDDGVNDEVMTQTLDRHGLTLTFDWSMVGDGGALSPLLRQRDQREADGTLLTTTTETIRPDASVRTGIETFAFTCAAARQAASSSSPTAEIDLADEMPMPLHRLHRVRR